MFFCRAPLRHLLLSVALTNCLVNSALAQTQSANSSPNKPTLQAAKKKPAPLPLSSLTGGEVLKGCGCSFYQVTNLKDAGPLHLRFTTDGKAAIKPGGKLIEMKVMDEQHVRKKKNTVTARDKMLVKMRGTIDDTWASLVSTAERNCEKTNSEATTCNKVTYQSLLTLATNGETRTYPLWGSCSCGTR